MFSFHRYLHSEQCLLAKLVCATIGTMLFAPVSLLADDVSDGREALKRSSRLPWYDHQSDSLKKVPLEKTAAPASATRNSNWEAAPPKTKATPNTTPAAGGPTGPVSFSFVTLILWVFVGMFLLAIVALLIWAFLRRETNDESQLNELLEKGRLKTDEERIENLPFEVQVGTGSLFDQAKQAYDAGKFREAMIYLYSHMLVQMDREHWIHLAKAKTNRQYLREVRANRSLANVFRKSMLKFEDTFFGFHDLEKSGFEECWNSMTEFNKAISHPAQSH